MAETVKQKEGWPFTIALFVLGLGTVWNASGGNLDSFGHIGKVVWQTPPTSFDELGVRFERLFRLPEPPVFPDQKVVPPKEMAAANKAAEKTPGPRPTLANLGGEGKQNPFLPEWARRFAKELEPPTVDLFGPDVTADSRSSAGKGPGVREDVYVFNGVVKVRDEAPYALLRDAQKKASVFLKEGEKYGPILALKVDLAGATFSVQGVGEISFNTLHSTNKKIVISTQQPAGNK